MYKWLLALAGWGLVSGCGSDDSTGSRRYEAEAVRPDKGEEESSTPTDQKKTKTTPKNDKSPSEPNEGTTPPKTTEPSESPEAANRIEKDNDKPQPWKLTSKTMYVDWQIQDQNTGISIDISHLSRSFAVVSVYSGDTNVWNKVRVPYESEIASEDYAEFRLTKTTWTGVTQTLTFWVKPSTSECEAIWKIDGYVTDTNAHLSGWCAKPQSK